MVLVPLQCCTIWCLSAFPYEKPRKKHFLEVKKSVEETSLGQFVALHRAFRTFLMVQVDALFTQHPAVEPKFDQIRARVR